MKKIAVVLSGSGVFDGSEIHESVITLLALDKAGASVQCFAPNIEQCHVVNHLTGEVAENETRNVLVESARIARGNIKDIADAQASDFDAVIFPGGFGAAKNLSDFAFKGSECHIQKDVEIFAKEAVKIGLPLGFMCIAPAMIPRIYGDGAKLTIGTDVETAANINAMGGVHVACPTTEFVIDKKLRVVSTPAYMSANSISEAAIGIEKLVNEVLKLIP